MRSPLLTRLSITGIVSQRPCLSLLYPAAVLLRAGHDVAYIEAECDRPESYIEPFRSLNPDWVGLTSYTPTWEHVLTAIGRMRSLAPGAVFAAGGFHATQLGEAALAHENSPDVVFCGEAEESIGEWAGVFMDRSAWERVPGLRFNSQDGPVYTGDRPPPADLDNLPFPAWALVDVKRYRPAPNDYLRLPHSSLIGSRGCPFSCVFCPSDSRYRRRSAGNIAEEIECLKKDQGVRDILFWDESILFDPEWTESLCREMIRRKLDITWAANARVDQVEPGILRTMRRAGCWQLLFGLESGSQDSLVSLRKGFTIDRARQAVRMAGRAGIRALGMFQLGIPGETVPQANETIKFAASLKLNHASFVFFTPYPGTEIFKILESSQRGIILENAPFDMKEPSYVPEALTLDQLKALQALAFRRFYLKPRNILNQILGNMNRYKFRDGIRGLLILLLSRRK